MITVMFRKVIRSSMLGYGMRDLRVFKVLDVVIIQPELWVIDGDFWEAHVKSVAIEDGQVIAHCYDDETIPSYARGQDWHLTRHINHGWFDNKPDAWADYRHKQRSLFQQTDLFRPFFVWSSTHGQDRVIDTATTRTDVLSVGGGPGLRADTEAIRSPTRSCGPEVRQTWIDEGHGLGPG